MNLKESIKKSLRIQEGLNQHPSYKINTQVLKSKGYKFTRAISDGEVWHHSNGSQAIHRSDGTIHYTKPAK
jgi:hypothetical protein